MIINQLQTKTYKKIIHTHLYETIAYLLSKEIEFAIVCHTDFVQFDPPLPKAFMEEFKETIMFILSGYTYRSIELEEDQFTFEAGFGSENIGSLVTLPLLAIQQIYLGDELILINQALPDKEEKHLLSAKNSMEALLKNPENQKLLKKKKRPQ
jgi:hypothetical protein